MAPVIGDGVIAMRENPTSAAACVTARDDRFVDRRIGDETALPTSSRPASNCGLTSATSRHRERERGERREDVPQRNERDIDGDEVGRRAARQQVESSAGIDPFSHDHAGIGAEPPVELSVADIERDHRRGAPLKQHVGEAAS